MAWLSVMPSYAIRRFSSANGIRVVFDPLTAETNCPTVRNPEAAVMTFVPAGAVHRSCRKTRIALQLSLNRRRRGWCDWAAVFRHRVRGSGLDRRGGARPVTPAFRRRRPRCAAYEDSVVSTMIAITEHQASHGPPLQVGYPPLSQAAYHGGQPISPAGSTVKRWCEGAHPPCDYLVGRSETDSEPGSEPGRSGRSRASGSESRTGVQLSTRS